ncbi:zinc ABC transporter substrate-binding protein [Microbacterium sp. cx-55]|uniref:metal ABC transporter solute-binding protein, Zn/Mn family n=1 Tax=Microbacterium sp. cx-55 TaxID=2875948 RepID=UPI001CBB1F2E|nr:zinc ABC transporter substrate-binding protein [Microbacterium sp. cx-55]MBZ4488475.1 zinc ABC transporter substrate-binding protein [Microbacterium sp. cx-55]UGB35117.1 zinc ABC transporter substrate-binding protein [Microbacterium sp. cx-55]
MPKSRLLLVAPALAAVSVLALAGCAGGASASPSSSDEFTIVTSTNVYGQIAQEIAGDAITVTPIITSNSQDPHEFEASPADQITVRAANLIIENGGGYDAFMDTLISGSGSEAPVIVAAEYSHAWPEGEAGDTDTEALEESPHSEEDHAEAQDADGHSHIEGFNEHVWYDQDTIKNVTAAIAQELSAQLPDQADTFEANAAAFTEKLEALQSSLADIKTAHAGEGVFVTEPVPGYMIEAAGLENVTPSEFSEAVEEGQDVPPATLLTALNLIGSGDVKLLIANSQAAGAETTQTIDAAGTAGVPVLEFSETLPDDQTYVQWMQQNIEDIATALGS